MTCGDRSGGGSVPARPNEIRMSGVVLIWRWAAASGDDATVDRGMCGDGGGAKERGNLSLDRDRGAAASND